MELRIQIVKDEGKESGMIHVFKVVGERAKKVGEMKFADEQDRRWLLMVMTEDHSNVSVLT